MTRDRAQMTEGPVIEMSLLAVFVIVLYMAAQMPGFDLVSIANAVMTIVALLLLCVVAFLLLFGHRSRWGFK